MWFWLHHSEAKYFGLILATVLTATLLLSAGCGTESTNKPSSLTQALDEQRPPEDLNVELTKAGRKFAETNESKELPGKSLPENISDSPNASEATGSGSTASTASKHQNVPATSEPPSEKAGSALVDLVKKIQPAVVTIISFDKDNNPVG